MNTSPPVAVPIPAYSGIMEIIPVTITEHGQPSREIEIQLNQKLNDFLRFVTGGRDNVDVVFGGNMNLTTLAVHRGNERLSNLHDADIRHFAQFEITPKGAFRGGSSDVLSIRS